MVKPDSLQLHKFVQPQETEFRLNHFGIHDKPLNWVMNVDEPHRAAPATATSPKMYLSLAELECFEVVKNQYQDIGVKFENCIAIKPSNPAFPTCLSPIVLMAAPKNGFLEVRFTNPVSEFSAFVTSSQPLVLSAYGCDRQLLIQSQLKSANLKDAESNTPPNTKLTVKATNIQYVTFYAFDGQFTIDGLSFCF